MKKLLKYWPFFLFFLLLVILFSKLFYPHLSIYVTPDFGESDILNFNYPLKDFLSRSLKKFELPLWSKDLNTGFPLFAEGQIGTLYLPNLFLFFFLPAIIAFNFSYIIHITIAFFSMFFLTKKLKFTKEASFLSSFSFAFSFYLIAHFSHLNLFQAACLLPLIFCLFLQLTEKPDFKNIFLFSFSLSQQLFAGYVYVTFITVFTCLLYFLARVFFKKNRLKLTFSLILKLVFSFVLFFLLSAVQVLPTLELASLSNRQGGLSYEAVVSYPFPAKHLVSFVNPYAFGKPQSGTYPPYSNNWGIFWENTPYIGLIPLILAILTIFWIKKKATILIFWLSLIVSLLLVLGKSSPFYFIFTFPIFNYFRVPSRYLLMAVFSLTILAGYGLDIFLKKLKPGFLGKKLICLIVLLISIFDLFSYVKNYHPVGQASEWLKPPETAKFIKSQAEAGRIISLANGSLWNTVFLKDGWKNVKPYQYFQNDLYANLNLLFDLSSFQINTGGLKLRRNEILFSIFNQGVSFDTERKEASLSAASLQVLNINQVKYLITPLKINNNSFKKIFSVKNPNLPLTSFYIYKNEGVWPRVYLTDNYKYGKNLEEFYGFLQKADNQKREVVLSDNLPADLTEKGESLKAKVKLLKDDNQQIILRLESNKKAILVLSDTFYPGWQAFTNNKETKIIPINITGRGVIVPKGKSTVKFIYRPISFQNGLIITLISYLAVFIYFFKKLLSLRG